MNDRPKNPLNPADGQPVLVQDGRRVSGTMTEEQAKAEAARLNRLNEQGGQPTQPPVQVKRNLCG